MSTTYLGSWAFIEPTITTRFLFYHYLFLLEVISVHSFGPPPFQVHLKLAWELFPLDVMACIIPFMQFVKKGLDWLQENIFDKLHNYSFFNIISNIAFNSHYACLRSCEGPKVGAWLFVCLIVPPFHLPSNVFTYTLHTKLGFPHFLALKVTHCLYGQPLNVVRTHLFLYSHGGEWNVSHDVVQDTFVSIVKDARFHVEHE